MSRNEFYIIPENFKNGNYIFNRYKVIDLIILCGCSSVGVFIIISVLFLASTFKNVVIGVIGVLAGLLIISLGLLLTINVSYYHNVLGKVLCIIRFMLKQKQYKWKGIDYKVYEE